MTPWRFAAILPAGLVLVLSLPAAAHVQLRQPVQRTSSQKDGPCGAIGSVRGTAICSYRPGATIRIRFEETVEHAGHFRLSFDADGQDFINPTTPQDVTAGDGVTIIDNAILDRDVDSDGNRFYVYDLTLPGTECDSCTLQLIQVMSTAATYSEGNLYYQCADIVLSNDAPETPTAECAVLGGGEGSPDAGPGTEPAPDSGSGPDEAGEGGTGEVGSSGCAATGASGAMTGTGLLALVFVLAGVARRRRDRPMPPRAR